MFVLVARGDDARRPDRPRPTILYGYGGFGLPLTPGYSATVLAWVEAGGVYAIANLRGGGEEGEDWHRAGMLGHKQNVFDDFHAAAEWLVDRGLDDAGAAARSPAAPTAACSSAPPSPSAPTCSPPSSARPRCSTWCATSSSGSARPGTSSTAAPTCPRSSAGCWRTRRTTACRAGAAYPAVLFTVFDGDTRVDPMHARKMCAALQHATTRRPAGPAARASRTSATGPGAVSRAVDLSADALAFTAACTGLEPPAA